jgi:hypothetical protein
MSLRGGLPTYSDLCSSSNCNFYPNYSNRIRLAVTPASPDTLYVLYGSPRGFTIGLYRSDDRGNSFTKRSSTTPLSKDPNAPVPLDLSQPNIFGYRDNDFASQSNYTIGLAISPTNADLVHVGAVDTWESDDGGRTWQRTSRWDDDPDNRKYVHADVHELADRGGTLYAATDGGIYRSGDGGNSWESITKMTTGITIAQIYHVCGSQREPDVLYYGAQDNGSYRLNIKGEISKIAGGDGFVCQVDPRYSNTVYVGLPYGDIHRTDDVAHANVGMSGYADITPTAGGVPISGAWLTPFILSPADPNSIYACYADLWYSSDRGLSWVNLTNGALGPSVECRQVAVSPSDPKTIYVAKEASWDQAHMLGEGDARTPLLGGGGVFRSTDGGANWQWVTGTLPLADAAVTDLAVSPTDSRRVWVTFGGYRAGIKVFGTQPKRFRPVYRRLIGLQFGPQVARAVIKGTYLLWNTYDHSMRARNLPYNFASRSSVAPQRADNILCIALSASTCRSTPQAIRALREPAWCFGWRTEITITQLISCPMAAHPSSASKTARICGLWTGVKPLL